MLENLCDDEKQETKKVASVSLPLLHHGPLRPLPDGQHRQHAGSLPQRVRHTAQILPPGIPLGQKLLMSTETTDRENKTIPNFHQF